MSSKKKGGAAKKMLAVAVAILLIAVVATRCTSLHSQEASQPGEETVQGEVDAGQPEGEGGNAGVDEETGRPIEPDEEMQKIIGGYGDEVVEAVDFLRSNAWTTFDSAHSVEFGDCWYQEHSATGDSEPVAYAVTALSTTQQTTAGAVVTLTTLAMQTSKGGQIVTIGKSADAAGEVVWTVTSDGFSGADSYLRRDKSTEVICDGFSEQMLGFIGGDTEALDRALTEYCRTVYPQATTATWEQTVTIDEAQGTVSFSVMLDASLTPSVGIIFDTQAKTFEVGRQR